MPVTFERNALIKASAVAELGYIGAADDSGLCVDHLGDAPGVFSARYSGPDADDAGNRKKLLREMDGVPECERGARFVCVCALVLPEGSDISIPERWQASEEDALFVGIDRRRTMTVRGECRGFITDREIGSDGFGYDPLFWYPEFGKTFAEVGMEGKNGVSHRGKAMRVFTSRIRRLLGGSNMTSKQRAILRSEASKTEAIFQRGKGGVSDAMIKSIGDALEARELIKISVLDNSDSAARDAAEEIAEATGSEVVSVIGRKIILFRRASKPDKRKISLLI